MTFLGIENTNEFFTQHYLTAILQGDLRPVLDRWRAAARDAGAESTSSSSVAQRPPPQALGASHQAFFRYLDLLEQQSSLDARTAAHFEMFSELLADLGYGDILGHRLHELPGGHVPLYGELKQADGSPLLWLLPVVAPRGSEQGTLSTPLALAQLTAARLAAHVPAEDVRPTGDVTAEDLVNAAFNLDEPPRFILLLGLDDVTLVERAKWAEQRLLRFDLREILGRRQPDTLDVTAALLHRESLVPHDGIPLLDDLNDNSHKHAFAVSEDLKYALQASIERLGNAAVEYIRKVKKQKVFGEQGESEEFAEKLSRECLRYMYRLLFLFYIEARPELGYAPMGVDAYRLGYSLERLRELEQLDLSTDEARNGTYIHRSLRLLFDMIYDGRTPAHQVGLAQDESGELGASHFSVFELAPLRSHVFDPTRTPLLDGGTYARDAGVVFSNEVLRDVIENMSLTRPGGRGRRGRISYATLGINQLGAVYEALLSFRGFLAKTDLFEVKPAGDDKHGVLDIAYFVPEADLPKYTDEERVYDGDVLRKYAKGTFIYRLAGRDRQTSASYYTPEVLTRATVKYALKELLGDDPDQPKLTADEILRVTVCEPAMGSAAFLNEAVNQLSEAYLAAKQRELGDRIAHDKYGFEKQRVKMFIADNNVFGVDLNPIAVELAAVSLWLNTIHEGGFVPWFTGQTVCGNSLIGARRQVFRGSALSSGSTGRNCDWLDTVPTRVPMGTPRPEGAVYHFLLGDRAMSVYGRGTEGQPIHDMAGAQLAQIDDWRHGFNAPLEGDELVTLTQLSGVIDGLWNKHADLLKRIRYRTTDPIQIYGQPPPDSARRPTTTADKDRVWEQEMLSETVRASSPYRRLKLVMDYWCALWFWPIEQAELLPTRDEFIEELARILDTTVYESPPEPGTQFELFPSTAPEEAKQTAIEFGLVNLHTIVARSPRLQLVEQLGERYRFLHWELEFADVFRERGGFDMMLGNPPWLKVEWSERDALGDIDPAIAVRDLSSEAAAQLRLSILGGSQAVRDTYLASHESSYGILGFVQAASNYPALGGGVRANLYRCFLALFPYLQRLAGSSGFLHPEGVYDDPNGASLRELLYPRLRRRYQFFNEHGLFPIGHTRTFSINIYGSAVDSARFVMVVNLFSPGTIDACHAHSGAGNVPPIKRDDGAWNTSGHSDRVVEVDVKTLTLFAALYDGPNVAPLQARLPRIHSKQIVSLLSKLRPARKLDDLPGRWMSNPCWHERHAQRDGVIRKKTSFPSSCDETILCGPQVYVGNPFYKSARSQSAGSKEYDVVDLEAIDESYLPRTVFTPCLEAPELRERAQQLRWDNASSVDCSRIFISRRVDPRVERTLQAAVLPPGVTHVDTLNSYAFEREADLVVVAASWMSLVADLFIKSTGTGDLWPNQAQMIPLAGEVVEDLLAARALRLTCLTRPYADLWNRQFRQCFREDSWTISDVRLNIADFDALGSEWRAAFALRSDYCRRQALVEMDVLVAISLGLTLSELCAAYRSQFYVLRQNELDTWYDLRGRIVFTVGRGLVGIGLPRNPTRGDPTPAWNDVKDMKSGTVSQTIIDDTQPGGPRERTIVYEAPFDRCDRERDYEVAWAHFEKRFGDRA